MKRYITSMRTIEEKNVGCEKMNWKRQGKKMLYRNLKGKGDGQGSKMRKIMKAENEGNKGGIDEKKIMLRKGRGKKGSRKISLEE